MSANNPIWDFIVDAAETIIAQTRKDLETLPEKGQLEKPHFVKVESTPDVFKAPYVFALKITTPCHTSAQKKHDWRDRRMMEAVVINYLYGYKVEGVLKYGLTEDLKAKLAEENICQELCDSFYEKYKILEEEEFI